MTSQLKKHGATNSGRDKNLNTIVRAPAGSLVNRSGTITLAATPQTIAPENTQRKYLILQNVSPYDMAVSLVGAAGVPGTAGSLTLSSGDALRFADGFIPIAAVSVRCPTAGAAFTCYEG